ncbi:MAG: Nudix family hydrolase [Lysobacteraceae bacterium]
MSDPVHVVAAVLVDDRGRILLSRRVEGQDLAGAWEFPGGKVEPGEGPLQALARELDEELGIAVDTAGCSPLIAVPFAYAHKRIVLDVYRVGAFGGVPRGREKQALAWAPPSTLPRYHMPDADRPVVAALLQPDAYLITPQPTAAELDAPSGWLAAIEAALARGVRRVQFRVHGHASDRVAALGHRLAGLCRQTGAELLVNSATPAAPTLVEQVRAGLHLTAKALAAWQPAMRARVPGPLAASCHDAEELERAGAAGVDFAVLGPVQATASHPGATPLGWQGFSRVRERSALPVYALGGLSPRQHAQARRHGAQGIAGIRGFQPADPVDR